MRDIIIRQAKWKPLELSLPTRLTNWKQYCITGGVAKIMPANENLKDWGLMIPSLFNLPGWKTDRSYRVKWIGIHFTTWWFQCVRYSRCGFINGANEHIPWDLIGTYVSGEFFFCYCKITGTSLLSSNSASSIPRQSELKAINSPEFCYSLVCRELDCFFLPLDITLVHHIAMLIGADKRKAAISRDSWCAYWPRFPFSLAVVIFRRLIAQLLL